jgi:NTP pyrophosphatase (non-canonical NTP hydrolase)
VDLTIGQWGKHFFDLYGFRNASYLDGLADRVFMLQDHIGRLQTAIRKSDREGQKKHLVNVAAWVFGIAGYFPPRFLETLENAMAAKWGSDVCRYCKYMVCRCGDVARPAAELVLPRDDISRGLAFYQSSLARIYGEKNVRAGGVNNALNRLFVEAVEVARLYLQSKGGDGTWDANGLLEAYAQELSDVLAWTVVLAGLLKIELEQAVFDKYGKNCSDCQQLPCVCGRFQVSRGKLYRKIVHD